ncbi:MAG: sodium/glucose cotransporter [Fimbriimonadales bacterium]|nr:MAG: sodium/glucose cotransporter [Fimbriimonadales bacterium]
MRLETVDWVILCGFLVLWIVIGALLARRATKGTAEYFLAGRSMPWWLLGVSMVATTFSTDTPNLVTGFVREDGVAANWQWWAFLLTGMLTTFLFARLWRKSGVLTDIELYELRYSGKMAAFLRGFRSVYLGLFLNVFIMATVTLAAIKIGGILLGASPIQVVVIAGTVTAIYSLLGGLSGVLVTDLIQFAIAMFGSFTAAYFALQQPEVGGLQGLLSHPELADKLSILPDVSQPETFLTLLILPLAVWWWSVWYPGAEPGGGGYIAQRMLAAKNEAHSQGAVLLFNVLHYALRPWPWILVALASLIVFPDISQAVQTSFPHYTGPQGHDLGYSLMLSFVPPVFLGIIVTSLAAAYMSTISTHLNWGASYIVNDFYKRFLNPQASERTLVIVGQLATAGLMVLAALVALRMENAQQVFDLMLQVGAGTGLVFILRWFWWRVNAACEVTGMVASLAFFLYQSQIHPSLFPDVQASPEVWRLLGVAFTTVCWLAVAYLTPPTDLATLKSFVEKTRPGGPGWRTVYRLCEQSGNPIRPEPDTVHLPTAILCMIAGCVTVYGLLFSTGEFLYGRAGTGTALALIAAVGAFTLIKLWPKLSPRANSPEHRIAQHPPQ